MNTSHRTRKLKTWLQPHVTGLLAYAAEHANFATELAAVIKARNWKSSGAHMPIKSSPYLTPGTQVEAVQLAQWIVGLATTEPAIRHTLAAWAQHYDAPKDLVIGIVGLAIMGPTLGILEQKKKKKSQLAIIIDQQWYASHSKKELVQLVQNLSQEVMATEINQVGGNVYQLHPDSAQWCLGEPRTKLYLDNTQELTQIQSLAQAEKLSHAKQLDDQKLIAIALSPAINESYIEEFAAKEAVE